MKGCNNMAAPFRISVVTFLFFFQHRLEGVKRAADKMMHLEAGAAGAAAAKDDKGKGKRGRMTEKAEDDILMKRAETEAAGKDVYADDLRLTVQPVCLQNGTLREYQLEVCTRTLAYTHTYTHAHTSIHQILFRFDLFLRTRYKSFREEVASKSTQCYSWK